MYPYKIPEMLPNFPFSLGEVCDQAIEESAPHMRVDFPDFSNFSFAVGHDDTICILTMEFQFHGIPTYGSMDVALFRTLREEIGERRSFNDLRSLSSLDGRFDHNKFLMALDVSEGHVDWHVALKFCMEWLNALPLQRAQDHNTARVLQAIPTPPQFNFAVVQEALWVLECDQKFVQGTGFDLKGIGTVTNHHVVNPSEELMAFRAGVPTQKFPTKVLKSNAALDLAIIEIVGGHSGTSLVPSTSEAKQMDHIAVCGFPNYQLGDTGVLTPGLIIGLRPKSGVQRLLTNAPIVAGMSGGPAIGRDGNILGICVSGSETFRDAGDTEDHAIIPVSALDILK
jgi:hypothetical protein